MYLKNRQLTATSDRSSAHGAACTVIVMYGDLRDFSIWAIDATPDAVANLVQEQYERVLQIVNDHHPDFYKFMGDGFLLVWETDTQTNVEVGLLRAIDAAYHIHKSYYFKLVEGNIKLPAGYGVGISLGPAVKVQPRTIITEFNEIDFVGYPLNCGARMQTLAGAFGVTLCARSVSTIETDPDAFLYPSEPEFARKLSTPSAKAKIKAASLHGLRVADQTDFRYLTWPRHNRRWGLDGIP